jgi:hypothetical protein
MIGIAARCPCCIALHVLAYNLTRVMPLPLDAMSGADINFIENTSNPLSDRQTTFAQDLFRHWVERPDQIRCRLFFECLSAQDRNDIYNEILTSLSTAPNIASVVTQTELYVCIGEFDYNEDTAPNGCAAGKIRFDCDHADDEADAKQLCEIKNKGFRHSWMRTSTRDGNRCGYGDDTVTCFKASPRFP